MVTAKQRANLKPAKKGEVRNCVGFLQSKVPEGIKQVVLGGEILWRVAKRIYESRQPGIKAITNAMDEYHKKETIQNIIDNEQPSFSSEPYRLLGQFTNTMSVDSVKKIEDKYQVEQVKRYLRISGLNSI